MKKSEQSNRAVTYSINPDQSSETEDGDERTISIAPNADSESDKTVEVEVEEVSSTGPDNDGVAEEVFFSHSESESEDESSVKSTKSDENVFQKASGFAKRFLIMNYQYHTL